MKVRDRIKYQPDKKHMLKNPSSFIVVVLKSLICQVCLCCGKPIESLEESIEHWEEEL